jgi:hypothetical protein
MNEYRKKGPSYLEVICMIVFYHFAIIAGWYVLNKSPGRLDSRITQIEKQIATQAKPTGEGR